MKNKSWTRYSTKEYEKEFTYEGNDLGASFLDNRIKLKVWAPEANEVKVFLYNEGELHNEEPIAKYKMISSKNGTWSCDLSMDFYGKYYVYNIIRNGISVIANDPYAKAVGVNGDRALLINLEETNPDGWDEDVSPFAGKDVTDAVIYEMHVRDFTIDSSINAKYPGKYLGVCETGLVNSSGMKAGLDYIKDLGVTHVHLLPIADYATVDERECVEYNWGYDPKNYNVPEGSYSTNPFDGKSRIIELKTMIRELHKNGISVIMDVVYNHTYVTDFSMNKIVPDYFFRKNNDNDYSNGSGCGNDVASERSMVRKFIVDSVKYWADEYHIDGFRFDLMGLIDVDTMNEIRKAVDEVNPEIMMYGEGWDMPTDITKDNVLLASQKNAKLLNRIAMFNDDFRDGIKGKVFYDDENGYVSGNMEKKNDIVNGIKACPEWDDDPNCIVNFVSCHDNNTLFDKLSLGNKGISFEQKVKENMLCALIEFTCQGISFIHAGEEMLRTKIDENGEFIEDSVRAGDKVNSIKWDDLASNDYKKVADYYKGLIQFRKNHKSLRMTNSDDIERYVSIERNDNILICKIDSSFIENDTNNILVMVNPSKEDVDVELPAGIWKTCCDNNTSGIETLYNSEGSVKLSATSGMILIN